jgi:hypothetical protein
MKPYPPNYGQGPQSACGVNAKAGSRYVVDDEILDCLKNKVYREPPKDILKEFARARANEVEFVREIKLQRIEAQIEYEERIREECPAVQEAWESYQTLLGLAKNS